jgi:3'-phosphoadenosine 5'-phosphosulfate sulfotransferase (PAPS reductase)/FAD synthetase
LVGKNGRQPPMCGGNPFTASRVASKVPGCLRVRKMYSQPRAIKLLQPTLLWFAVRKRGRKKGRKKERKKERKREREKAIFYALA